MISTPIIPMPPTYLRIPPPPAQKGKAKPSQGRKTRNKKLHFQVYKHKLMQKTQQTTDIQIFYHLKNTEVMVEHTQFD